MKNRRSRYWFVGLCLLLIFLDQTLCSSNVAIPSSGCTQPAIIITISNNDEGESEWGCHVSHTDEFKVNCSDLQSAINWTLDMSFNTICIEIQLPNGEHIITQRTDFKNASIHFIGLEDQVFVQCNYYPDSSLKGSHEIHTWYFDHSESVSFKQIHFRHCGFPFRFDTVKNVKVNKCTFR